MNYIFPFVLGLISSLLIVLIVKFGLSYREHVKFEHIRFICLVIISIIAPLIIYSTNQIEASLQLREDISTILLFISTLIGSLIFGYGIKPFPLKK
jgi:uncharacterized membrane protein YedE/YeeE